MKRNNWLEHVVSREEAGMTVERILREKMAVSGRMMQRLTRSKGIQLNRKPPYLQRLVKEGDCISIRIADKEPIKDIPAIIVESEHLPIPDILYEDDDYLIVNKPAGMMVHPVKAGQSNTLVQLLAAYLSASGVTASIHPVHRLDKETSGAILLAKSGYAHQLADRKLREGKIKREYLAVVCGRLEEKQGRIAEPIDRDVRHKIKRRVVEQGEAAITHFTVLAVSERATLVSVRLETGRTHQIRVHFQHIGHPLAGDSLYGGERLSFYRQALHAHKLSLVHPRSGDVIRVEAPLPDDIKRFLHSEFTMS